MTKKPTVQEQVSELLDQAKKKLGEDHYAEARQLLFQAKSLAQDAAQLEEIRERLALATYKDADLSAEARLARAWEYLTDGKGQLPLGCSRSETFGIAGGIHKRLWDVDGVRRHLDRSCYYYRCGHELGKADQTPSSASYCGINLAFVLDLLASIEAGERQQGFGDGSLVEERRDKARRIRRGVIRSLPALESDPPQKEWWYYATLAEAYFGIGEGEKAKACLERGRDHGYPKRWEEESTIRQLAFLARAQAVGAENEDEAAQGALMAAVGEQHPGARTAHWGTVGLALSGGGFRASLYHLGVLAALAEHDVLRHVEVLSCVSGGSIIGAKYSLAVKELLEEKSDLEITSQHYLDLVRSVAEEFCAGISKNIRTRVVANWPLNVLMIFSSRFSRTQRAGSLYEKLLYGSKGEKLPLRELVTQPKGERDGFHPKYDNWRRRSKVPNLVLNATTLNTGHNWQFTATWMGEPPATIDPDVDSVSRLRRMYHHEAPVKYRSVRLGHAVAASACVPGLFEPLELSKLYEKGHIVRLVDGGVHDNQGVAGLLEQDCQVLLVSDASGQMDTVTDPSRGPLGVPLRSNSILMARVRAAQLADLRARRQSERVRGLMFVHLKQGLTAEPVHWIGCPPAQRKSTIPLAAESGDEGGFQIDPGIQKCLSKLRTDLDSFSEIECYGLMLSGYEMTKAKLRAGVAQLSREPVAEADWPFLRMRRLIGKDAANAEVTELLDIGEKRAFKIWHAIPALKWTGMAACVLAVSAALWFLFSEGERAILTYGGAFWLILSIAGGALITYVGMKLFGQFSKYIEALLRPRNLLSRVLLGVGLATVGWILALVHLLVFDRLFLKRGKIDRWWKEESSGERPPNGGGEKRESDALEKRPPLNTGSKSERDVPRT
ncbi:MAG: patatin-like phospholipase family protein [Planctomycetota bacterium]